MIPESQIPKGLSAPEMWPRRLVPNGSKILSARVLEDPIIRQFSKGFAMFRFFLGVGSISDCGWLDLRSRFGRLLFAGVVLAWACCILKSHKSYSYPHLKT